MAKPRNTNTPPAKGQQPVDQRKCRIFASDLFYETRNNYKFDVNVLEALLKFIRFKRDNPLSPFGSKDYPFKGDGPLHGLPHAGLTFDVSIVYSISGKNPNVITLYGIFSHDELGTGNPGNQKRMKQAATRIFRQTNAQPLDKIDEVAR